jgi:hypothetical protein
MLPSWTRNSSWAFAPSGCGIGVERNNPPTLRSETRETSSASPQRQQTHTFSGVSNRELNLLEYTGIDKTAPTNHLWPCGAGRTAKKGDRKANPNHKRFMKSEQSGKYLKRLSAFS